MGICIYTFILLCCSWNFIISQYNAVTLTATEQAKYLYYEYTRNRVGDVVYWFINSAPSTTINLTLVESTWNSTPDCQTDRLYMIDYVSPLEVKCCGSKSSTMQSHSNKVVVVFNSGTGFHATFRLRYKEMRPCNLTTVPDVYQYVDEGDRFTLSCTSDCPSPVRYSWYRYNYKSRVGAYLSIDKPDGNLTVNHATRNHDGLFICTASHHALTDYDTGYSASKSVNITVFYSTHDMKTIVTGGAVGGAIFVVVLMILVFVLIRKRIAPSKKAKRETDKQPTEVSDDDLQKNRKSGNENVSLDPDYDYMELEIESTKSDKNTVEEGYLVPLPPENYSESSTDNKELRDSYSKLEDVRIEQNLYEEIRHDESPSYYKKGISRPHETSGMKDIL